MPVWPAELPQKVLQDGYSEILPDPSIRTSMEQGPPKVRRRSTGVVRKFGVALPLMTGEQTDIFENFFENECSFGSIAFDWVHPRKGTAASCRIIGGSVSIAPMGANFRVSFELEVLP